MVLVVVVVTGLALIVGVTSPSVVAMPELFDDEPQSEKINSIGVWQSSPAEDPTL